MLNTNRNDHTYIQTTRWVLVAVSIIAVMAIFWAIRSILLLMLAAIILVVFFNIPVRFLARFNVRRGVAVIAAVLLSILVISLLARVALPTLLEQFTTLTTAIIPNGVRQLIERFNSGEMFDQTPILKELFAPFEQQLRVDPEIINDLTRQLVTSLGQIGVSVLPVVGDLASTVLSVLVVIFLSLYMLVDPEGYRTGAIRLAPVWYRERASYIGDRMHSVLRGWLEGTFLSMIFVGIGTWMGLSFLRLEQAAALGVIAGVLSFVPNFGQLVAVIAAVVVGVVQAPENIGWIVVVIYGISFFQSQVFSPILFAESINLPPVLVLLGQIICGALFGFMGILLAVPITAILMVLIQEVYIKDILGDRAPFGQKYQTQQMPAVESLPSSLPAPSTPSTPAPSPAPTVIVPDDRRQNAPGTSTT